MKKRLKMKELVKIKSEVVGCELVNSVNARDLYKALEITKPFADWIKNQISRTGLEENVDFTILKKKSRGGRPTIEYIITSESSKYIAMMSRGQEYTLGKNAHGKAKRVREIYITNYEVKKNLFSF